MVVSCCWPRVAKTGLDPRPEKKKCPCWLASWFFQGYQSGHLTKEMLKCTQPFLGVPFTVKETITVKGFCQTGGLLARAGYIAENDALVVANLKKAGAILLATTNVSEVGMWWETDNKVYGRTSNPYDTRRTSGGSSGGEASLMCGCGTALSIGTDTGGSIRTPAFFCGLFGHKPTAGLVSVRGCNIFNDVDHSSVQAPGSLCRHAHDLAPVLEMLAGENSFKLRPHTLRDIPGLTVYSMEGDKSLLTTNLREVLLDVQHALANHFLQVHDITVKKVSIPEMSWSYTIWQGKMSEEYSETAVVSKQLANNEGEINVWTEMTRALMGRARHTWPSLIQALINKVGDELRFLHKQLRVFEGVELDRSIKFSSKEKQNHLQRWRLLKMRIQRLLGDRGILLYPSHPTQAPYHYESYFRPFNFTYTAIFNALGLPVTQVPLGLHDGLPLGIQVVGGMYNDKLTIAVAEDLEKAFGGWKCPSKIL